MTAQEVADIRLNNKPKGWMLPQEISVLKHLAEMANMSTGLPYIVEIGAYLGLSTSILAQHAPTKTILSIDPHDAWFSSLGEYWYNVREYKNVKPLVMRSSEAYELLGEKLSRKVALLFIDGAHDFDSAFYDISHWADTLDAFGLLAVHDCEPGGPSGPRMAMGQLIDRNERWSNIVRTEGLAYSLKQDAGRKWSDVVERVRADEKKGIIP